MKSSLLSTLCVTTAAVAAAFGSSADATDTLLYDVTFWDHPAFETPLTGNAPAPRTTISHIALGEPLVYPNFIGMFGKPCGFNGGDQFRLWLFNMPTGETYDIEYDLLIDGENQDPYHFDVFAPNRRTFHFDGEDGRIHLLLPEDGHTDLGPYYTDEVMKIRLYVDVEADLMALWVNDVLRYFGGNEAWGPVSQVAFGCQYPDADSMLAAVDNITIIADVPEPTCPADLNDDGEVGPADLTEVLANWGPCQDCAADFDDDGQVGPSDLTVVLSAWGSCGE